MNEMFKRDYYAFYGEEWKWGGVKRLISNRDLRYVYVGRMSISAHTSIVRKVFRLVRHAMAVNRCAEISFQKLELDFISVMGMQLFSRLKQGLEKIVA